ncbi:ERF family protein [Kocuria sp.]|uniref:ERF family protein n=1 Tax=Kocuria sp. TaxID=1871328 RepID=UPI0026DAA51A|nr:ERF family protein [Kocuria sp.]MDO4920057.1 ERF family protein [Kocuria sp.]
MTTVYQALAAVMAEVREVRKGERNKQQGFNFRGIDAVVNAVGPALRKHGVVIAPTKTEHHIASKNTAKGTPMNFVTVTVDYTVFGPEGDHFIGQVSAESFDAGDKGTAKAMSVAYRTFLLQALCLPTDDPDPDHDYIQETRPHAQPAAQAEDPEQRIRESIANAVQKGPDAVQSLGTWAGQHGWPEWALQELRNHHAQMRNAS